MYLDLRARGRRDGRPTDELLVLYVLERFLYRLSVSDYSSRLVLKGGMLLAAFDERRPTADVDLLATAIANDVEMISAVVREVLAIGVDDELYGKQRRSLRGSSARSWPLEPGTSWFTATSTSSLAGVCLSGRAASRPAARDTWAASGRAG